MKNDIIVIGSSTRDVLLKSQGVVVKDPQFPTGEGLCFGLGSKIEIEKMVFTTGGGGTNVAVTFARQGLQTSCIGVVGSDFNAQEIFTELANEHVDTSHFQKHSDDYTAYSVILVDDSGERTILSYKGEGQHFDANQIPFDQLESSWLFLSSVGGHLDILEKAVAWAQEKNIKIACNPGSKELGLGLTAWEPLMKHFSVVVMNQEEAAELTGIDYKDEIAIFKKMDDLIDGVFVMTKGPLGVVVSDGTTVYRAGVPDSPVVERTGAGDAFSSGFVSEYIRSGDIKKAIQLGTANASSVVTEYGAKAGILKAGNMGPWSLVEVTETSL